MKLLNQSIKHTSISLLFIIGAWGLVFFYNIQVEIRENVDEGLENYKRQIVLRAQEDTGIPHRVGFNDAFYEIREVDRRTALSFRDQFTDTSIYLQKLEAEKGILNPVRMLTTAFEDDGRYYVLRIVNPMVEKEDLIHRLLFNMVWLYVVLIVAIVLINNLVLQRLWKPFYELLHKLQTFRLGSGDHFPSVNTRTKEFQDLQQSVDTLLLHNLKVYEQQKQFIGNASHELQTPLAIAMSKLELLLENGSLDGQTATSVGETLTIIGRLIRLNKSLLLLSKIENGQFFDKKNISLNKLISQGIKDLAEYIGFKEIEVEFKAENEVRVNMDPALGEILINNLLRNAVFHNRPTGKIQLILTGHNLTVANTGQKDALDSKSIFKRFYKTPGKPGSTGLGLAIIKAIADLYGISVEYQFKNGFHKFSLSF